ncbi:MOSC domain-containing protein [Pelagibacterium halotolerans B2]|uniref:MOSC domain-containing protein n=1 Tax=Pelagibacterium halotolerans (strain DSM 22347 / JCM 15775 / CGMCC 1.7692 / B2) TaxID=1082931 RepID=G4R9U7_PELHB|nr:MOSC domain-containing protein [Pelagibacterium halotolerans B2]
MRARAQFFQNDRYVHRHYRRARRCRRCPCGQDGQAPLPLAVDPDQPNLRQVHLVASELLDEVNEQGFEVAPGALGENITTRGIDLIGLPRGTVLAIGDVRLSVTGLRNPCSQIEKFRPGLLKLMVGKREDGTPLLRTGIMTIAVSGGSVRAGDTIEISLPAEPHSRLERV